MSKRVSLLTIMQLSALSFCIPMLKKTEKLFCLLSILLQQVQKSCGLRFHKFIK